MMDLVMAWVDGLTARISPEEIYRLLLMKTVILFLAWLVAAVLILVVLEVLYGIIAKRGLDLAEIFAVLILVAEVACWVFYLTCVLFSTEDILAMAVSTVVSMGVFRIFFLWLRSPL